jgi:hypothetical protein
LSLFTCDTVYHRLQAKVAQREEDTLNSNPFIEAREKVPSAISTLPPDYLNGNAAPLLAIVEELSRSYRLELRIIQAIKDLNVSDPKKVAQFTTDFQNYHQYRDFDKERTHCRNIDRISGTLLVPLQAGTQADLARVGQLEGLIAMLVRADDFLIDEIEPVMDRALAAANLINTHVQASLTDPTQLAAARQEQQAFKDEFDSEFARLKTVLKEMNILANDLIDRL